MPSRGVHDRDGLGLLRQVMAQTPPARCVQPPIAIAMLLMGDNDSRCWHHFNTSAALLVAERLVFDAIHVDVTIQAAA